MVEALVHGKAIPSEEETNMMRRGLMIALMGAALALVVTPHMALAGGSHLEQAITETKEAIHEGKQDLPTSLVEHAVNAIDHARAAQRLRPNDHIRTGIAHLKRAIKTAKGTHSSRRVAIGTKHAETALAHFEAVK
jgi:hypothetical protein